MGPFCGFSPTNPGRCALPCGVSLAGWWRAQDTGSTAGAFVEVTQTGDTVTIPVALSSFPGQLTGTITGVGEFNLTGVGYPCSFPNGPVFPGRLLPGASVIDGVYLCPSPTTFFGRLTLTRCTCHDGNTVDGDGCDATCQVEPCFTCTGDPSVCTSTPDGGACDDRHDCTTGETCTAGICGGGSLVVGCTDTTGVWQVTSEELGVSQSGVAEVVQRGGIVTFGGIPTGFHGAQDYIGTIDPGTGAFDVAFPSIDFVIGCPVFSPLTGVAGVNAFSSSGTEYVYRGHATCESFPLAVTGTRIP
jgi:cysteine-rich repeat protein